MSAIVRHNELGKTSPEKYMADSELQFATAAICASDTIKELIDTLGTATTTGWLNTFSDRGCMLICEIGAHTSQMNIAPLTSACIALAPLIQIPPTDEFHAHFLDGSDYMSTEDIESLVDYLKETLCRTNPSVFNTALAQAEKELATLTRINTLFGIEPDGATNAAISVIINARTAKAENVALGIVKTFQSKAVKLKRVLIEHSTVEFADVWPRVHEIVKTVVANCTFSAAKA
jgi:hypothetical protein